MAPGQDQLKCNACKSIISEIHQHIKCVKCLNAYHSRCVGLSGKNRQDIQKIATVWHCCQSSSSSKPSHTGITDSPILPGTNTPPQPQTPRTKDQANFDDKYTDGFKRLEHLMLDIKQTLQNQLSDLQHQIAIIVTENTQLKHKLERAEENNSKLQLSLSNLEAEVDYLKEKENINNIVISGIPDKSTDPYTLTLKFLKTINSTVPQEQINSAQYIGKEVAQANATSKTPQHYILVKLASFRAKQEIIEKKKAFRKLFSDQLGFKGDNIKQIFIRDHLTLSKLKLFRAAREFKIQKDYQFLWTTNNRILLRKAEQSSIVNIKSLTDLERLAGNLEGINKHN